MEPQHRVPSVFEVISCDSLKNGLREALRYLLDHIYQVDSIRQLPIPRTDEAILLLDLVIEYNHLRSYNASYAEKLYNLVRLSHGMESKKINNALPSLICLTLVPYIRRKLDKYFEELNYRETRTADELKRIRIYRIFTRSCSLMRLICLVRFAAGKSNSHNLLDGLLNIYLVGRTDDITNNDDNNLQQPTWVDRSSKLLADLFGHGLTVGSYFIQFLDYWNTHSNSAPLFNASLEIPDPPKMKDDEGLVVAYTDERSSNICLICLHVRQNECALSNTGYVFCYSCLQRYVTTKQRCPITGHPTTVDNIVKLFTSSTPF